MRENRPSGLVCEVIASPHPVAAFTLIELLVVIAIVGLLAAMLAPALSQAREKARQLVCMNNLHTLGIAANTYAGDFNGKLPRGNYADPSFLLELSYNLPQPAAGLGLLLANHYCGTINSRKSAMLFFCPSIKATEYLGPGEYNLDQIVGLYNNVSKDEQGRYSGLGPKSSYFYRIANYDIFTGASSNGQLDGATIGNKFLAADAHWSGLCYHQTLYNVLYADGHVKAVAGDAARQIRALAENYWYQNTYPLFDNAY